MSQPTILVAGIGNIFLGDDGFGSEVARRLAQRPQPAHVRVMDFGIRGLDLAYALLEPYELIVLVDVLRRDAAPGTVHILDVSDEPAALSQCLPDTHGMIPTRSLEMARTLGAKPPRMVLVGCEPARFGDLDDGNMALSPPVAAAIDEAIAAIQSVIATRNPRVCSCTSSA